MHAYTYDADNRLTEVRTSHDGLIWNREARYRYFAHGPLARTELGQFNVQGIDYAYTLQGWIKGVNRLDRNISDMGNDGAAENAGFSRMLSVIICIISGAITKPSASKTAKAGVRFIRIILIKMSFLTVISGP